MRRVARGSWTALFLVAFATAAAAGDPLPSWKDGPAKESILDFVRKVTTAGGAEFVPEAERIATFDNDGTLWAEQPFYFQLAFAIDRVEALAPEHPEWKEKEPFKSVLAGDLKAVFAGGEHALLELVMVTHAGMTPAEFGKIVKDWLVKARHPRFGKPYTQCVYQPMLELLLYLRASGFKTYLVSGGGVEFMRAFAEKVYGIPPEQTIGSTIKTKWEMRDGKPAILREPGVDYVDDKTGKPLAIERIIGRRPIAAFGNSDGDLEMLQWTAAGDGARLCLLVHHTDAKREWAYDRESKIGHLDKALDAAKAWGWTVVSMKDDWNRIFVFEGE
ncbi:MAG TPA: HAD family hydrolase [Planctomycetota bacterium]|nr:HAD family hydrolase [Planctomycetota bacterium]